MAYNSDGYIMVDFSMVDFRRTNQTIDGLFDRCEKVIGTNKFVIVINANNKTPLPSTVCITNGQYVIESVLYTFSISSNDNLHITKKTTPEELIDDDHITLKTTWSSYYLNTLFDSVKVKEIRWIGNGKTSKVINFPVTPKVILCIGNCKDNTLGITTPIAYNFNMFLMGFIRTAAGNNNIFSSALSYNGNEMTITGSDASRAFNYNNEDYMVYYI